MPIPSETRFSSGLWRQALETFAEVTHLTVELYGDGGKRLVWGPVHPTPLFELFAEHGWDPGTFGDCARRCLAQGGARPAVTIARDHGLAVVGAPLVLGGEVVGAVVGGYALVDFSQAPWLQRLARRAGVPFARLWEIARRQPPVPARRLVLYGELLQVLGDALLRENERSRQVEDAADRLIKSAAAKDEFLAVLSHELRTPLTPILTWSSMLQQGVEPAMVQRGAEVITRNALLQVRLVEDLLDLNRITLGKVTLDVQRHDLREVVGTAIETIAGEAEKKGVLLAIEAAAPLPVEGDGGRLQQILRNLLSNALKFTPKGGSIRVTAERAADGAVVRVRDTGQGIPREFLPQVFEIFRQQEGGTRRSHSGLGIGLAVAKRLTELHHGTITVASDGPGTGAEVTVRLPLAAGGADAAGAADPGRVTDPLEGLTLLFVEDMPDTREATRLMLERLGATVLLASDGREGIEVVERASPDLVLCDLRMPGMDGFEFISVLRRSTGNAEPPVIAVSGLASATDREHTRKAGFQGHVSKPFEDAALVTAIDAALGRPAR
ncbi:MAG TPA: hybrid sensor histidine kinase/response regulator [Thermoanaerobaculia bacterium]|nr:hybrid sensor histidine kinase/response regulator [Thermoanaerobaculia bacterium]